jgi:hypothetical protein
MTPSCDRHVFFVLAHYHRQTLLYEAEVEFPIIFVFET